MCDKNLEKIDILRDRFNISYSEAQQILEENQWNIVKALIYLEEREKTRKKEDKFSLDKDEIVNYIKDLIEKGNATRIKIKKNDKLLLDIPLTGAIAVGTISAIYPKILAVLTATAIISRVTIEVIKTDGTVEVINEIIKNAANTAKDTMYEVGKNVKETVKYTAEDIKEKMENKNNKNDFTNETSFSYSVKFDE